MQTDLTHGKITVNMLLFALPLMAGNLLQQMYNIADTWVVGHYIGTDALGAVGSAFCVIISLAVCLFAEPLMKIFIDSKETAVIAFGAEYLKIEGAFYIGIGILFLLYGYFRAVEKPEISVVLTVASLGTRVALAYALSALPILGVHGIWMSVPIGWAIADLVGIMLYIKGRKKQP